MAAYLITLAIGPVQSLIEAARRTRDLWCGSWLLSEAAKAAALSLHHAYKGCLVFPCPIDPDAELAPADRPGDIANVSNIIRAWVEEADAPAIEKLCAAAKQAAVSRLRDLCTKARKKIPGLPFHEDQWNQQIEDILESYAAWTEIAPDEEYGKASQRLGGLLAARKATRDFRPAAVDPLGAGYSIRKSSLDAACESVIKVSHRERDDARYKTAFRKLGLAGREELDALAVAKRLAGEPEQFTAYSRVAADPWIQALTPAQQQGLQEVYEPLVADNGLATRAKGNAGIYAPLPYDAQLVYDFRLANARGRGDLTEDEREHLEGLRRSLRRLGDQKNREGDPVGAPVPYAVILKADGDRMGKLLSSARKAADSRGISKALQGFANGVPDTVRKHRGHAIYSGGDDVLALLPLESAVEAADALRLLFQQAMEAVADGLNLGPEDHPTLSVGLGIGHVMEPLGSLRARADAAERAAKGNHLQKESQRNALAIQLGIRSGAEYSWRGKWEPRTDLNDLLAYKAAFRSGELPSRVAYDLRAIAQRLDWLGGWSKPDGKHPGEEDARRETADGMRAAEVRRMLERARTDAGKPVPEQHRTRVIEHASRPSLVTSVDRLLVLADTLLIARWLAARSAADVGDAQHA